MGRGTSKFVPELKLIRTHITPRNRQGKIWDIFTMVDTELLVGQKIWYIRKFKFFGINIRSGLTGWNN
jgi:hypothetical protein